MRLLLSRGAPGALILAWTIACGSRVDDARQTGGAGGGAPTGGTTRAATTSATSSASTGTGLPPPTMVCSSFVAGNDGGGERAPVEVGSGSEDLFVPFVAGQTLQMEWGFQGLQHFAFTPRMAGVTQPTVGFAELVPDTGENRGLVQIYFPPCEDGWSEIVGYVMALPLPIETSGTLRLTVGVCPADLGCDPSRADYGFVEVLGAKEVRVDVLPPEGPQPGAGGGGGEFG